MNIYKFNCLVLSIFLLNFVTIGFAAELKPTISNSEAKALIKKKWATIEGFRSAKFGMKEKKVFNAISKDFQRSRKQVKRHVHPIQKTTALIIRDSKLMEIGGVADIVYLFGYNSKRLMQINIDWGEGVIENYDPQKVILAAELLRRHFIKKKYQKKSYAVNQKVNDTNIIVFRGKDKKGRSIFLRLKYPKVKKGKTEKVTLKLSYIFNREKPDIPH
jgi:hypothetical protein